MTEQQSQVATWPSSPARLMILLIFAALAFAGCTALQGSAPETRDDAISAGRQVYVANCVACHGEKGDRVPVAPLNIKEFLDLRGDATLFSAISGGKGVMPAWGDERGGPLTRDQISAVVAYLNASAGRTSPTILASSGRTVFQQECARCHGDRGDRIPAVPLAEKSFLNSRTDAQLIDVISDGKSPMPAFRSGVPNPLSEEQVQALVSYLRYNAEAATAEEVRQGRDLYMASCLHCHGERGNLVPNVALTTPELLRRLGDGRLTSVVSEGSGVMPGFGPSKGGTFQASQIGAILAYLKSSAGLPADTALIGPEKASQGRDLYINSCAGCHGEGGNKVAGANLRSPEFLGARSDEALQRQISQGNTRGMPAWGQASGGPLSPAEIKSLVDYLRGVAETSPPAGDAPPAPPAQAGDSVVARGKDIFTKSCTVCHGAARDLLPSAKLADASWLQQRGDAAMAQSIANGKGAMPAWGKEKGGQLSQDDIAAVLAYLKSAAGVSASTTNNPPAVPGNNSAAGPGGITAKGKEIYAKYCGTCHGENRSTMPTAKLGDADWLQQRGDNALSQSIANGKELMPAWGKEKGGPLSPDDIAAVLAYLNEAARGGQAASGSGSGQRVEVKLSGDAARGRDLYAKNCQACHGQSRDRVSEAKLADAAWLQERGDAALGMSIANGKGAMPSWGEEKGGPISKDDIAALLEFFKAMAGGR
ncbi:MAG: c-type cytochrome [Chloroflexi bacterium]|nr:c-type cytochrome [Chloroflexota bacterium]